VSQVRFHLAFPVADLQQTKAFYVESLRCTPGRESSSALILNFYGHQLVAQVTQDPLEPPNSIYPRHFGLVFDQEADWEAVLERSRQQGLTFYQEPKSRFPGTQLEHRTFFLEDPSHNLLEFKFYTHPSAIFDDRQYAQIGEH